MFGLYQTSHFGLLDIIPPSPPLEAQLAFHKYVKYENTLTCKMISWDSGRMMFQKYFSIAYMYYTKCEHFSPKIKLYKIKCKITKYRPTTSLYMKMEAFDRL